MERDMRNAFSALVIASAFALLVPDNGAVGAADLLPMPVAAAGHGVMTAPAVSDRGAPESPQEHSPEASWLIALGFLGAVIARRLRAD
jgi:hypothetical protein